MEKNTCIKYKWTNNTNYKAKIINLNDQARFKHVLSHFKYEGVAPSPNW